STAPNVSSAGCTVATWRRARPARRWQNRSPPRLGEQRSGGLIELDPRALALARQHHDEGDADPGEHRQPQVGPPIGVRLIPEVGGELRRPGSGEVVRDLVPAED